MRYPGLLVATTADPSQGGTRISWKMARQPCRVMKPVPLACGTTPPNFPARSSCWSATHRRTPRRWATATPFPAARSEVTVGGGAVPAQLASAWLRCSISGSADGTHAQGWVRSLLHGEAARALRLPGTGRCAPTICATLAARTSWPAGWRLPGRPARNAPLVGREHNLPGGPAHPAARGYGYQSDRGHRREDQRPLPAGSMGAPDQLLLAAGPGRVEWSPNAGLEVVGFMLGEVRSGEFGLEEPTGWIEVLGVDPAYRGKAIGQQMAEAPPGPLPGAGRPGMRAPWWTRAPASCAPYFGSLGFQEIDIRVRFVKVLLTTRAPPPSPDSADRRLAAITAAARQVLGERLNSGGTVSSQGARTTSLLKSYHDAVVKWRETFAGLRLPARQLGKALPQRSQVRALRLLAARHVHRDRCGDLQGQAQVQARLPRWSQSRRTTSLGATCAPDQASTRFGSIQQHRLTARPGAGRGEQFWILRLTGRGAAPGYQMLHLLARPTGARRRRTAAPT